MRCVVSPLNREEIRSDQVTSALCRAEATIREIHPGVGGSILSFRRCLRISSRTRSGPRSACATFSASHTVTFVVSAVVQVRKPRCVRI